MLTVEEAIARVPGWRNTDVELLGRFDGGTNRSFHVRVQGLQFVLRIDAEHTAALGLDRKREFDILESAAAAGLGPRVDYADGSLLVTTYIDEPTWTAEDLSKRARLERVATLLRQVHGLPLSGYPLDASRTARTYLDSIPESHDRRDLAIDCVRIIDELCCSDDLRLCHNDVIAANIIGVDSPRLIDWEYACDNDPLFDLACLIEYHGLDDPSAEILLRAYGGQAGSTLTDRLAVQRRIYVAFHTLWSMARECAAAVDEESL